MGSEEGSTEAETNNTVSLDVVGVIGGSQEILLQAVRSAVSSVDDPFDSKEANIIVHIVTHKAGGSVPEGVVDVVSS